MAFLLLTMPLLCEPSISQVGSWPELTELSVAYRAELRRERAYIRSEDGDSPYPEALVVFPYGHIAIAGKGKENISGRLVISPFANEQNEDCIRLANGDPARQKPCHEKTVYEGFIAASPSTSLTLGAGIVPLEIGGWEIIDRNEEDLFVSDYMRFLDPFNQTQPVLFGVATGEFGDVRFQLTNDVTTEFEGGGEFTDGHHQPTAILSWTKEVLGLRPKIQATSYDQNNSRLLSMGVKSDKPSLPFAFSWNSVLDQRRFRIGMESSTGFYIHNAAQVALPLTAKARMFAKGSVVKFLRFRSTEDSLPNEGVRRSWSLGSSYPLAGEHMRAFGAVGIQSGRDTPYRQIGGERRSSTVDGIVMEIGLLGHL